MIGIWTYHLMKFLPILRASFEGADKVEHKKKVLVCPYCNKRDRGMILYLAGYKPCARRWSWDTRIYIFLVPFGNTNPADMAAMCSKKSIFLIVALFLPFLERIMDLTGIVM